MVATLPLTCRTLAMQTCTCGSLLSLKGSSFWPGAGRPREVRADLPALPLCFSAQGCLLAKQAVQCCMVPDLPAPSS